MSVVALPRNVLSPCYFFSCAVPTRLPHGIGLLLVVLARMPSSRLVAGDKGALGQQKSRTVAALSAAVGLLVQKQPDTLVGIRRD